MRIGVQLDAATALQPTAQPEAAGAHGAQQQRTRLGIIDGRRFTRPLGAGNWIAWAWAARLHWRSGRLHAGARDLRRRIDQDLIDLETADPCGRRDLAVPRN